MRLSVDQNDPGYQPDKILMARVMFNGQPITDCVTADEEEGMVLRYARNADGKFIMVVGTDEALLERLFGRVSIYVI